VIWANVPAPPANQQIGIPDGVFDDLEEADCRFCHENPDQFPVEPEYIPDRHHLLYGSIVGDLTAAPFADPGEVFDCFSCHDVDCSSGTCNINLYRDCMFCHNQIPDESSAHHLTERAMNAACAYCHGDLVNTMPGYCTGNGGACAVNGDCAEGECDDASPCHEDLDCAGIGGETCYGGETCGDGHFIPTYQPSLVTPAPSRGEGLPYSSEPGECSGTGNPCTGEVDCEDFETCVLYGAGACTYCHSTGTGKKGDIDPGMDTETGFYVYRNYETHHLAAESYLLEKCDWCHNFTLPYEYQIRICERCHGYQSLHNIQADSDSVCSDSGDPCIEDADCPGIEETCEGDDVINPGIENPFYGHIGNPDDCWGCHGYVQGTASGSGPVVPTIFSSDITVITEGTDTTITLTGSGFINFINDFELTSIARLRAADGSIFELTPDAISEDSLTVTIPGTVPVGNCDLRALKGSKESNPVIISVKPDVIITNVDCNKKRGLLTVTGLGFREKVEGTDAYINLEVNGMLADINSWTDTRIKASVSRCSKGDVVTVNALFGSATNSNGKPPKPCKGKGCNK
jgi:hypothetical protein